MAAVSEVEVKSLPPSSSPPLPSLNALQAEPLLSVAPTTPEDPQPLPAIASKMPSEGWQRFSRLFTLCVCKCSYTENCSCLVFCLHV